MRQINGLAALLGLLLATTLAATARPALAASGQMTPVPQFGSNPGNLLMFEWIPADLPPNAPVVVVLHGCFANAALYDDETGWTKLAERWKVALVFPEQTAANDDTNCFRFWNPQDIVRGQGEALSIKQMVDWTQANHATDPGRVFIMGHSGGGLFTSVMLATYPDVFKAGAIVAGGPYKCGDEAAVATGIDGSKSPVRGGECVDGSVTKTPQEWGDLARSGYPGYSGPKPRVSIWHGTADTLVSPKNMNELVKQWTNFNGIDDVPDLTSTVKGYPHRLYTDSAGQPLVESYELTGQSHGWPYEPGTGEDQCDGAPPSWNAGICASYFAGRWFGLDVAQPGTDVPEAPYPALLLLAVLGVGGGLVLHTRKGLPRARMSSRQPGTLAATCPRRTHPVRPE
jgi:poly(hydroxyalkanoate) depolymerase family esterase